MNGGCDNAVFHSDVMNWSISKSLFQSNASLKCPKFVAKIADFEEAYRDTLTRKMRFGTEFWTFRQAGYIFGPIIRLDYEQALRRT